MFYGWSLFSLLSLYWKNKRRLKQITLLSFCVPPKFCLETYEIILLSVWFFACLTETNRTAFFFVHRYTSLDRCVCVNMCVLCVGAAQISRISGSATSRKNEITEIINISSFTYNNDDEFIRACYMQRLSAASFGYKHQSRLTGKYPWSIAKTNLSMSTEYIPLVILNAICWFLRSLPFALKVERRKVYSNGVHIFSNVFITNLIRHWLCL
jgi:hypothetical protein